MGELDTSPPHGRLSPDLTQVICDSRSPVRDIRGSLSSNPIYQPWGWGVTHLLHSFLGWGRGGHVTMTRALWSGAPPRASVLWANAPWTGGVCLRLAFLPRVLCLPTHWEPPGLAQPTTQGGPSARSAHPEPRRLTGLSFPHELREVTASKLGRRQVLPSPCQLLPGSVPTCGADGCCCPREPEKEAQRDIASKPRGM